MLLQLCLICSNLKLFFCDVLQLHEVTETTYKDDFTDSPFTSSEFGKAKSFAALHATNR